MTEQATLLMFALLMQLLSLLRRSVCYKQCDRHSHQWRKTWHCVQETFSMYTKGSLCVHGCHQLSVQWSLSGPHKETQLRIQCPPEPWASTCPVLTNSGERKTTVAEGTLCATNICSTERALQGKVEPGRSCQHSLSHICAVHHSCLNVYLTPAPIQITSPFFEFSSRLQRPHSPSQHGVIYIFNRKTHSVPSHSD